MNPLPLRWLRLALVWLGALAQGAAAQTPAPAPSGSSFDVEYEVRLLPTEGVARVAIHLTDVSNHVGTITFSIDRERQREFQGDGVITVSADGDRVAVRLRAEGTHSGELFGIPASGQRRSQEAIVIYRLADGKIVDRWTMASSDLLEKVRRAAREKSGTSHGPSPKCLHD